MLSFDRGRRIYAVQTAIRTCHWAQTKNDVIAYQIRQSFVPGEIRPRKPTRWATSWQCVSPRANMRLSLQLTRIGNTSTTTLFITPLRWIEPENRDFLLSALAVQRLSDLICLEHQLSVIEIKPYRERQKRTLYPPKESNRDRLCGVIDTILTEKPKTTKIFCKDWSSRVMRSSAENTPPSRAHGRNDLYDSVLWAQDIVRKN